jgi:hypothetical protein
MKKIILSPNQLDQIINLREKGSSWLKIQKETGIARRIAKREYDEWCGKQSQRQLEDARKDVAAKEYQIHLILLSRMAESLLDLLVITDLPAELRADEVMMQFLRKDFYQDQPVLDMPTENQQRDRRVMRMNELLFKSLRDHTKRKIDWKELDKWKQARNNCVNNIDKLKKEVHETFTNILNQKIELKAMLDRFYKNSGAREYTERGILINIWLNDVVGITSLVTAMKGVSLYKKGTGWVIFHKKAPTETSVTFDREGGDNALLAKEVADAAQWTIDNLLKGASIEHIKREVKIMKEVSRKFDEVLNQLVLRPIILNTRCDICPI